MSPRKGNGPTRTVEPHPDVKRLAAWIGAKLPTLRLRLHRAPVAVRPPRRPRLRAPRTGWCSSRWPARRAARAGIALDDFLLYRLSQHLARLPVPPARLPLAIDVGDGGAIVTRSAPAPTTLPPWLDSFLRAHGPAAVSHEIQLHQADAARLAARIDGQRRRVEEATREVDEVARGESIADPGDDAQAEQMGRPPVPPPLGLGLQLFALALLAAETWQVALPWLEAAGVRTARLAAEVQRDPAGVVLGLVFALGASVSLFLFGHLALRRGEASVAAQPEGRRRIVGGALSALAAAAAVALAWAIAGMHAPAGGHVDPRYARAAVFLVAIALPFTAAWVLGLARRLEAERSQARAAARAWDLEHYRRLAEVSRRAAALADEEQRLARLEADRAAAVQRARALQQRAATAERLAEDAAGEEEAELAAIAQALVAALDRDRFEYLRVAARRGGAAAAPDDHRAIAAAAVRPAEVPERNLGLAG